MSLLTRELAKASLAAEEAARLVPCPDPYRCRYHLCPPVGWLSDPNGLCQVGDVYHGYFQYSPLDAQGSLKMWGHATTRDLVSWDYEGVSIYADQWFDCHGAYSGSAIVEDGVVKVLYTGNVKLEDADYNYIDDGRIATQIYVESQDGSAFGRKVAILSPEDYPDGLTCHVRDPKVWSEVSQGDGTTTYYMVLGARRRGPRTLGDEVHIELTLGGRPLEVHPTEGAALVDQGEVLVYRSKALDSGWELAAQVSTPEPFGYMWECPDWFMLPIDRQTEGIPGHSTVGVLSFSPQGLQGSEWERRNVYQSGYLRFEGGLLDGGKPSEFHLWDAGFDFYAPQSFKDDSGRRILIGWLGVPDTPQHHNPTLDVADAWQHCFCIPREVLVKDGRIVSRPVEELEGYRGEETDAMDSLSVSGEAVRAFDLEIDASGEAVEVLLAGELSIHHGDGRLTMRFGDTSRDSVGGGRSERYEDVGELRSLRIVGDASTIEVFVNGGADVFSTRYYPASYSLSVDAPGSAIRFWPLVG